MSNEEDQAKKEKLLLNMLEIQIIRIDFLTLRKYGREITVNIVVDGEEK